MPTYKLKPIEAMERDQECEQPGCTELATRPMDIDWCDGQGYMRYYFCQPHAEHHRDAP